MKTIGLGIGLLLFSILFRLCSEGLDVIALGIGAAGLIAVIYGACHKE